MKEILSKYIFFVVKSRTQAVVKWRTQVVVKSRTQAIVKSRTQAVVKSRTQAVVKSRTHAVGKWRTHAVVKWRTPACVKSRTQAVVKSRTHAVGKSRTHAVGKSRTQAVGNWKMRCSPYSSASICVLRLLRICVFCVSHETRRETPRETRRETRPVPVASRAELPGSGDDSSSKCCSFVSNSPAGFQRVVRFCSGDIFYRSWWRVTTFEAPRN